jgi:hypothetical protein
MVWSVRQLNTLPPAAEKKGGYDAQFYPY